MTAEVLQYPPLEVIEPAAAQKSLKDTALASFVPIESHLRTLAARYRHVVYDVTTPSGMADAKAARLVLRDEGRYAVQRLQKRLKDEANDLKRTLDAKADEMIAIVRGVEEAIDKQIEAEEQRRAAVRAERERIERERITALDAKLAALAGWIDRCRAPGMTAERIANGIAQLERLPLQPDEWQEYHERAVARRSEVLGVMRELYAAALVREDEAQRLETQRQEQARIAAEQAERQRELDAQAAALRQQQEESEAARQRAEADGRATPAPPLGTGETPAPVQRETPPNAQAHGDVAQPAVNAVNQIPDSHAAPAGDQGLAPTQASEPEPTIKLGDVCSWLGFTLTAAFVTDTLCIHPAGTDKRAVLFAAKQRYAIRAALVAHLQGLA